MATDWAFYYLTQPFGLMAIGLAIGLPFVVWRLILGAKFPSVGARPLAIGYLTALLGLSLMSFGSSYLEFTRRVDAGILPEDQRWSVVPGWSIYIAVLSLLFVLPALGFLAVPVAGSLIRTNRLNYRNILIAVGVAWIGLTIALWSFPSNMWHETHRMESFKMLFGDLAPGMVLVALPFFVAIYVARRQVAERAT